MGMNIFQFAIANLFANLFLAFILVLQPLAGSANPFLQNNLQTATTTATQGMNNIMTQAQTDTAQYSACPNGQCQQTSNVQNSNLYEPILALYNFAAIIAKAIQFIGLAFWNYMTMGFLLGATTGAYGGPTLLFGMLVIGWNLVTWYLFLRFVVSRDRIR